MKNLVLLFMIVCFSQTITGQTTKGTWVVGLHNYTPVPLSSGVANLFPQTNSLGISFGTSKEKYDGEILDGKETNTIFGFTVNFQYFVVDRLAIGLVGNFSSGTTTYKYEGEDDEKFSASILLLGPEMRYYFDAGVKTKIWLKGGAAIGSVSSRYDGESSDPTKLSQFGGGAGLSIFPASAVSIDVGLGYNILTATDKSSVSEEYKSINSGLSFDIGFGIFF